MEGEGRGSVLDENVKRGWIGLREEERENIVDIQF